MPWNRPPDPCRYLHCTIKSGIKKQAPGGKLGACELRRTRREQPGDSVWSYRRHSAILFVLQLQPSHTISFRRKRSCSSNRIRERCPLLSQSAGLYRVLRQQRCGSSSSVKPIIVLCYARCKHLFSYIFSIVLQSPAINRKIRQQLSLL